MNAFNDYNEFVEYCNSKYSWNKSNVKSYKLNKDNVMPLYYETWTYIKVYKKSKNIFKRLFGIKVIDDKNCTSGYQLNPIIEIECLCPMIGEVDIKYRNLVNKEVYSARVDVKNIYYHN